MARNVKDAKLSTRTARRDLPVRSKPYFRTLDEGLHLGYRSNKRGGKWVMRAYLGDGAYATETIGQADDLQDADGENVLTFSQAQARARELYPQRLAEADGRTYRAGPYTVRDALNDYHEQLRQHGKSAHNSEQRAATLIVPELGDVEVARLTTSMIRAWHRKLAESPARIAAGKNGHYYRDDGDDEDAPRRRKASANRTLTVLKAALNHAYREGHIVTDEAWRRVQPYRNVESARVRYLSFDEMHRLLNACDPDFRNLARAALLTGMRFGELAALRVVDFNPDSATVHVRASKTGGGRHVHLNDDGVQFFKQMTQGRPGDDPLFLKTDGQAWGKSHQHRPMRTACARANINPPVRFHELRHTYASHAIMAGAPLLVVAQNLGHSDTRMVEKHYGHLAQSYVADTIRRTAPSVGVDDSNVVPFERAQ